VFLPPRTALALLLCAALPAAAKAWPAAHDGIALGVSDTETLLGAVSGGVKQGATLQGVTTATLDVDAAKALHLPGGTLHISALQIHGQPLSPSYLDNIQTASGTEAEDSTRLWEAWYDQAFGALDVKLGQQSIDNEFMVSQGSGLFVNTMAGWPVIPSYDLYGGGPVYPLAALGVRLRAALGHTTLLGGVFDDDPGGGAFKGDAQAMDPRGGRFSLTNGALVIAEIQHHGALGGLPGTYKIGGWYDSASFADPRQSGVRRGGNVSLYAVADQTLWRKGARSLGIFIRVMGAPGDRNPVDFGLNGGATLAAPFAARPNDSAGVDVGIAHLSTGGTETLLEATYQAQATPWLMLQPDVQYVVNPGGGIPDPAAPRRHLADELVAGLRATVAF